MEFRTLTADEIELRVGMANGKGFSLLLYKDARVDMQLLDETVGTMNWMREHQVIDGRLCCTVSVWDDSKKMWVSKQDVGTESQTEKDKGQFSDSFKRACVNLGIGRELYSSPFIWISGHVEADNRAKSGYRADQRYVGGLKVSVIEYSDKRIITKLMIEDADGEIVYTYGIKRAKKPKEAPKEKATIHADAPVISAEHAEEIKRLLQETDSDVSKFLHLYGAKDVDSMLEAAYQDAIKRLNRKMAKMKGDNE